MLISNELLRVGILHIGKVNLRSWVVVGMWIVLAFTMASIPDPLIINVQTHLKNVTLRFLLSERVTHMIMFGVLGFFLGHSFRKNFPSMVKRVLILWTFLISFLIALAIELYQQLVIPTRGIEIKDLIWDFVGIAVAVGYLSITSPKTARKSHSIS